MSAINCACRATARGLRALTKPKRFVQLGNVREGNLLDRKVLGQLHEPLDIPDQRSTINPSTVILASHLLGAQLVFLMNYSSRYSPLGNNHLKLFLCHWADGEATLFNEREIGETFFLFHLT